MDLNQKITQTAFGQMVGVSQAAVKMGIAGGLVGDWALYDSIYTERYMRTPQNNPDGYAKGSVIAAAKDLHGKLLIIHGAIDDNVHQQNAIKLIYELQKAGKQFEFMTYLDAASRSRQSAAITSYVSDDDGFCDQESLIDRSAVARNGSR